MVRRPAVIAILALTSVIPRGAWAQSEATIRGQVSAAADASLIGGAAITLTMPSTGAALQRVADADGRFVFLAVTPGEYLLATSAEGFTRREIQFGIEPREARTIDMALEIAWVAIAVEVAVERTVSPGTHSPSSTTLTLERLDAMPIFQKVTLADAIVSSAPGMIRGHDDFVHIRGHEVALNPLINGVSFWENTHAVFSAGLSPDVIETANVMTGGFPAEYGNRFGGVIDIVTRSGLRMQDRGGLTVSAGEAGRWRASGDVGGRRGRFGYFVFGSGFGSARFLSPPEPVAIHDEARGGHVFVQLESAAGRAGLIRAVVMADGTRIDIPRTAVDVILRPLANARQDTGQQTAIVSWVAAWRDVAVTTSGYQRWSRAGLFPAEGPLTVHAQGERVVATLGGKVDATRITGRHLLKAGIDAVRLAPKETLSYVYDGYLEFTHLLGLTHVHLSGPPLQFDGSEAGGQVSIYVQDNIQAGRMTLDAGLRVDHYGLLISATHASPRMNVGLRLTDETMVHASYNHFFVPPPIEGVLSTSAGLTRSIDEIGVALPPIEPVIEDQFEAGVTTSVGPLELGLTSYYRDSDNPVHTTIWPDSRIYSYASFDRGRAYGLEAKLEMPAPRAGIIGFLNYALGRVDFKNPVTGGFVTEAGHIIDTSWFRAPMDQTHTLTAGTTYSHAPTGLWMSGAIEYGSGTPMGHGVAAHDHAAGTAPHAHATGGPVARVPAHVTGGVAGGVNLWRSATRRPRLALQCDLENIANNVYVIAREGEFSPAQYSNPRLLSVTVKFSY